MNKIFLNKEEVADTNHEYQIGEIITMNSGAFPTKCVSKDRVDEHIYHYFTKGEFVPNFKLMS